MADLDHVDGCFVSCGKCVFPEPSLILFRAMNFSSKMFHFRIKEIITKQLFDISWLQMKLRLTMVFAIFNKVFFSFCNFKFNGNVYMQELSSNAKNSFPLKTCSRYCKHQFNIPRKG